MSAIIGTIIFLAAGIMVLVPNLIIRLTGFVVVCSGTALLWLAKRHRL